MPKGKGPRRPPSKDPSGGKGTIPPRGGRNDGRVHPRPMPTDPKPNRRKAAVDYVMARRKKMGQKMTRAQARVQVRKNIRADRKDRAYKYDFAGDGAGSEDRDYGTKANNRARKKHGYKPVKPNHRNHAGGNGNKGNKGDKGTTADDPGNSQSGDSYGGPQSLSAADRRAEKQAAKDKARERRRRRRRNHSGNSG